MDPEVAHPGNAEQQSANGHDQHGNLGAFTLVDLVYLAAGGLQGKEALEGLQARLRHAALPFQPAICKRGVRDAHYLREVGIHVLDWQTLKVHKRGPAGSNPPAPANARSKRPAADASAKGNSSVKHLRQAKTKANGTGRTYTSKYRGVHQTFPTKRWEAQFRRNGKPTSLGCFDREEEAARAYDKMMLWCELHNAVGVKSGITNFDVSEYDTELPLLQRITQDELIDSLRSEGRKQAAHRMMRAKREGQELSSDDTDYEGPAHGGGHAGGSGGAHNRSMDPDSHADHHWATDEAMTGTEDEGAEEEAGG